MTLQERSSGPEALSEALVFLNFFADLPDPRQAGKVIYPLPEILLLCLLAVLAGAESFVEIARFGEKKIELSSPVPGVQGWDPLARSTRRHLRNA
jgi:DDE_Tnp_1-associated